MSRKNNKTQPSDSLQRRVRPITVKNFWLQPTASFSGGAPQREEYGSDSDHLRACKEYGAEWRQEYICANKECKNQDCPQHWPNQ